MTRGQLKERIAYECRGVDTRYALTDWERLNADIDEYAATFASRSRSLLQHNVSMVLTPLTAVYGLRDTAVFSPRMAHVIDVSVDGAALRSRSSERGPSSLHEFTDSFPNWADEPASQPLYWFMEGMERIRLWPAPDTGYGAFVTGYALPVAIGTGTTWAQNVAGDLVEMGLPSDTDDLLGAWVAMGLVPAVSNEHVALNERIDPQMIALRQGNESRTAGPIIAGFRRSSLARRMGR